MAHWEGEASCGQTDMARETDIAIAGFNWLRSLSRDRLLGCSGLGLRLVLLLVGLLLVLRVRLTLYLEHHGVRVDRDCLGDIVSLVDAYELVGQLKHIIPEADNDELGVASEISSILQSLVGRGIYTVAAIL